MVEQNEQNHIVEMITGDNLPEPAEQAPEQPKEQEIKPIEQIPTEKKETNEEKTKRLKDKLNLNQLLFCELYLTPGEYYGNGTQAYIKAYNIDITKKGQYAVARAGASENLTKPNIVDYLNIQLDNAGFNTQNVQAEHLFCLKQHGDLKTKMAAVKEFYELKGLKKQNEFAGQTNIIIIEPSPEEMAEYRKKKATIIDIKPE